MGYLEHFHAENFGKRTESYERNIHAALLDIDMGVGQISECLTTLSEQIDEIGPETGDKLQSQVAAIVALAMQVRIPFSAVFDYCALAERDKAKAAVAELAEAQAEEDAQPSSADMEELSTKVYDAVLMLESAGDFCEDTPTLRTSERAQVIIKQAHALLDGVSEALAREADRPRRQESDHRNAMANFAGACSPYIEANDLPAGAPALQAAYWRASAYLYDTLKRTVQGIQSHPGNVFYSAPGADNSFLFAFRRIEQEVAAALRKYQEMHRLGMALAGIGHEAVDPDFGKLRERAEN